MPLVWLQRTAQPRYGRELYTLEVLSPDADVADAFLAEVRRRDGGAQRAPRADDLFRDRPFRLPGAGAELTFLPRPEVGADQVILPGRGAGAGARHVVGIGQRRDALRAAGQHLKRGVLLYGPPGTGKTHLVRHLLTETEARPRCCCPAGRSTC